MLEAIAALRAEGLNVRLELLEKRSNEEVRDAIRSADVVADQFLAGYGMFAVEGMSAGKPVLSRVSWLPAELKRYPSIRESPIVDADRETVRDRLRELITDPSLRREVGAASRAYALKYHSYEAAGRGWEEIFRNVWEGEPMGQVVTPAPRRARTRLLRRSASGAPTPTRA